ncbi:MAG: T9SS type A sorting domain-containing protein, partial [Saprospiraceae bacterium]|nr:T9SS type A sorting domain-containing protein [Saprospiraceae bacterium]
GIQDIDEPGIGGVTVTLTDENGDSVTDASGNPVLPTVTLGNGFYEFTNLVPGEYKITFPTTADVSGQTGQLTLENVNLEADDEGTDDSDPDVVMGMTDVIILSSGENEPDIDAGYYVPAKIGDFVWEDLDGNGIQDIDEPGLGDVTVILTDENGDPVTDASGNPVNPTSTMPDGSYEFTNLLPGDYKVTFVKPNGFEFTIPDYNGGNTDANDDTDDSDAADMGMSHIITLESGEDEDRIDAGLYEPASLGDFVWEDENGDGLQDNGEAGVNGVEVNLYRDDITDGVPDGPAIATATTADNNGEPGYYEFTNLAPGKYLVEFVKPVDFEFTDPNVTGFSGDDDDVNNDSDADPVTGFSHTIMLTSGEDDPRIDAGIYHPLSLGNLVWIDNDNDGVNTGEPGVPGVTLTLWEELNGDDVPDNNTGITETTNGSGEYLFTNLKPGRYIVQIDPSNFAPGGPLNGYSTSTGNDPVPDPDDDVNDDDNGYDPGLAIGIITRPITLLSGLEPITDGDADPNSNLTLDFGFFESVRIGDYVWEDLDGDGIQENDEDGINGVTVRLYDANTNTLVAETMTIQNPFNAELQGYYLFDNIPPGDYYVEFVTPDGYVNSTPNNGPDDVDSDVDNTNGPGTTVTYSLAPGEEILTVDAGYYIPALIGDYLWWDIGDIDFVQDENDQGLNDILVKLFRRENGMNVFIEEMLSTNSPETGDPGWYIFDTLATGDYLVEFDLPDGFSYVPPNQGGDDNIDSDVVDFITGRTLLFSVNPGDTLLDIDAGYMGGPVPVELVDFYGRWNKDKDVNELTWITATEINNDYFIIERSFNGAAWEEIGQVGGAGNSLVELSYEFDDEEIHANGLYTYRLKQVDYDGSYEFSDAINIRIEREILINTSVYPNPASEYLNIDITVSNQSVVNAMLLDVNGRLVKSDLIDVETMNGREKIRVNVDDVAGGSYIVRIVINDKVINHKVLLLGRF